MALSQGGLITSRALEDVKQHLIDDGLSRAEAEARLSRINLETFGAAAWNYTDGPRYGHHVNALDPVSTLFGQGFNPLNPLALCGCSSSCWLSPAPPRRPGMPEVP